GGFRYAEPAAAAPWGSSVVVSLKKLLVCAGLRSDAAGRPADLQAISVRAGLSRAGMNTSLVRHGLLVAGLTIPSPARLAIGISLRATAASNGPIIAIKVESATKPSTLEAPRLGFGKPPRASSAAVRTTWNPSRRRCGLTMSQTPMSD